MLREKFGKGKFFAPPSTDYVILKKNLLFRITYIAKNIAKKLYCKKKSAPERERILYEYVSETDYLLCSIAACAAANLAIGTRNGEQET